MKGLEEYNSFKMCFLYCEENLGKFRENFREKPRIKESWINAGFIVFDKKVFDHWHGENLEKEVFAHLIKEGLAYTYRHDGFFKSADNYKDILEFEELMQDGSIPWLLKENS